MKVICLGRKKMNKNYYINSICAKIAVLLSTHEKNYNYRQADLLYHLAISDFIDKDGQTNSVNIRNINSVLYYSKYINEAILKMREYNLLKIEGSFIKATYSCSLFVDALKTDNDRFENFISKLVTAHKICSSTNNVAELYDKLYGEYISRKIEGGY